MSNTTFQRCWLPITNHVCCHKTAKSPLQHECTTRAACCSHHLRLALPSCKPGFRSQKDKLRKRIPGEVTAACHCTQGAPVCRKMHVARLHLQHQMQHWCIYELYFHFCANKRLKFAFLVYSNCEVCWEPRQYPCSNRALISKKDLFLKHLLVLQPRFSLQQNTC